MGTFESGGYQTRFKEVFQHNLAKKSVGHLNAEVPLSRVKERLRKKVMIKIVFIDPRTTGISGEIFVSSLLDVVGGFKKIFKLSKMVEETFRYCDKFEVEIDEVSSEGIKAKCINFAIDEDLKDISVKDLENYATSLGKQFDLSKNGIRFIENVFNKLKASEANVYSSFQGKVFLDKIVSSKTVFEVISCALLLEELTLFDKDTEVYTAPPAVGTELNGTGLGEASTPAPLQVTLDILESNGLKMRLLREKTSLTTPTGAAILTTLAKDVVDYFPSIKVKDIGYGYRAENFENISGFLRVVVGQKSKNIRDKIVFLETDLDDVKDENLGYLVEKILQNGARDVSIVPGIGKKNRSVNIVKVLTDYDNYREMLNILVEETGTLGVKISEIPRIIAERKKRDLNVQIMGEKYTVTVKISRTGGGRLINVKPEYDDLKKIADNSGQPLRKVSEMILEQLPEPADL